MSASSAGNYLHRRQRHEEEMLGSAFCNQEDVEKRGNEDPNSTVWFLTGDHTSGAKEMDGFSNSVQEVSHALRAPLGQRSTGPGTKFSLTNENLISLQQYSDCHIFGSHLKPFKSTL